MRKVCVAILMALGLAVQVERRVFAQTDYPSRQIEFIIPFPPGGPGDTAARIIQPQLSANLGVPIVLVNKPGGGGALGGGFVAKGKPDGYTIYATTNGTLTIITAMQPDIPYRLTDFAPIGSYIADMGIIAAQTGAAWKTLEELVDYAKKNPGKLNYGSAGVGTVSFFTMELFKLSYGLDIAHVPFQGGGPLKNAILGGHVYLVSSNLGSLAPLIKSGDLLPLATTAPKRVPGFPNIPTMAEKGFPEASLNIWMGLYAPVRTPKPIIDKLARALEQTMRDPAVIGTVEKAGTIVDYRDPDSTRKLLEREHEAVKKVVTRLGIGTK